MGGGGGAIVTNTYNGFEGRFDLDSIFKIKLIVKKVEIYNFYSSITGTVKLLPYRCLGFINIKK